VSLPPSLPTRMRYPAIPVVSLPPWVRRLRTELQRMRQAAEDAAARNAELEREREDLAAALAAVCACRCTTVHHWRPDHNTFFYQIRTINVSQR